MMIKLCQINKSYEVSSFSVEVEYQNHYFLLILQTVCCLYSFLEQALGKTSQKCVMPECCCETQQLMGCHWYHLFVAGIQRNPPEGLDRDSG